MKMPNDKFIFDRKGSKSQDATYIFGISLPKLIGIIWMVKFTFIPLKCISSPFSN